MTAEAKSCRKKWKIAVSILLAVLILLAGGFFWYVSNYYRGRTWLWRYWQAEIIWRFGMI